MSSTVPEHVLVVGAGLGGVRTVEGLRSAGYEGRISLVGGEEHLPYDRPPLSKQFLAGDWKREQLDLTDVDKAADLGVRTHLGRRAVAWRPGEIELSDSSTLHADAIVLAPGVTSRTLPGQPASAHVLRTVEESVALREAIEGARSMLLVGAGFVGAEVASTAHDAGLDVTVLEVAPTPMARVLGDQVGGLTARLISESGVTLRCGVSVASLDAAGAELDDGSRVDAEVLVVGVGGRLDLDWLSGTGLDLSGGIPCDARGRVEGLDGVWAVGDAAAWTDPLHGDRVRHEHWTSATTQAAVVARDIAGAEPPPVTVPYFWSDQFGLKIQLLGRPDVADETVPLHGEGIDGGPVKGTVVGYLRGGELVAVAGFGAARRIMRYRKPLLERLGRDAVLEFRNSLG
ncbi:MAG: FAD-dependent oxidoreductase [Actinomycetota bacterium]|nr:FAD-dependent oxidoreductase [Actinomycetota bacterium]